MSISGVKAAFTIKLQWLLDSSDMISKPDLGDRLTVRLMSVNEQFLALEGSYQRLMEIVDVEQPREKAILDEVRRDYVRAMEAHDKLMIVNLRFNKSDTQSDDSKVELKQTTDGLISRLPALKLPSFAGNMSEWIGFNNLFDSLVDTRSDLAPAQKLAYLISCLTGEARGLVQHIRLSDDGYKTARDLLMKRYHNTRHLADVHVDQIMKLPIISARLNGLRSQFLNPLSMAINSLERLGLPVTEWSFILVHIVLTKLPTNLKTRFEQKYGSDPDVIPTFVELVDFLETECRLLECASPEPVNVNRDPRERANRAPIGREREARQYTAAVVQRCDCCGETDGHLLVRCPNFRAMAAFARKDYVTRNRLCFQCFGRHSYVNCTRVQSCDGCGSTKHHDMLCFNRSGTHYRAPVRASDYTRPSVRVYDQPQNSGRQSPSRTGGGAGYSGRHSPPRTGGGGGNTGRKSPPRAGGGGSGRDVSPRHVQEMRVYESRHRDDSPSQNRRR